MVMGKKFVQNHCSLQQINIDFDISYYICISTTIFSVMSLQEDQDWGFVAMVLDRLFLWMFTIASIAGTFTILCEAPALYDDTKPIDTEYSSVAQQQYLPSGQELLKTMVLQAYSLGHERRVSNVYYQHRKGSGELSFRMQHSCDRSWPWNRRNISKRETQLAIVHYIYIYYDSYSDIQIISR